MGSAHEHAKVRRPAPAKSGPAKASAARTPAAAPRRRPARYEFRLGANLNPVLARAAKDLAADRALARPELARLRRLATTDAGRMFVAGLTDVENVRALSRMTLEPDATLDFSLESIRAGMTSARARRRSSATERRDRAARAPTRQVQRNSLTEYRRQHGLQDPVAVMDMYEQLVLARGYGNAVPPHGRQAAEGRLRELEADLAAQRRTAAQFRQTLEGLNRQRRNFRSGRLAGGTRARMEELEVQIAAAQTRVEQQTTAIDRAHLLVEMARGGLTIGRFDAGGSRDVGNPHETNAGIQILNGNPDVGPVGRRVRMTFRVSQPGGPEEHAERRILAAWEALLAAGTDPEFTPGHLAGATLVVVVEQEVCPECQPALTAFAERYGVRRVVAFTVWGRRAGGADVGPRRALRNVFARGEPGPTALRRLEIYERPGTGEPSSGGAGPTGPAPGGAAEPLRVDPLLDEGAMTGAMMYLHAGAVMSAQHAAEAAIEQGLAGWHDRINGMRGRNPGQGVLMLVECSIDSPGANYRPGMPAPWTALEAVSFAAQGRTLEDAYETFRAPPATLTAGPSQAAVPRSMTWRFWWYPPDGSDGREVFPQLYERRH